MKQWIFAITLLISINTQAQMPAELEYKVAYTKLSVMLTDSLDINFKEAVFTVENAYYLGNLDRSWFDERIGLLAQLCHNFIASRELIYNLPDKEKVQKSAAIFHVLTDTLPIQLDSGKIAHHTPYTYDFNDIWGQKSWTQMFVSKLLNTKTGNCHSLPYLYKILADELGTSASLALAPNHIYIKQKNQANGRYNTELTSGIFPMDSWLMASGYVHLNAIVNKLYLEALTDKQAVALCLVDLAKGYQRKTGMFANPEFVLQCCETALTYYPNCISALLLKAETKKQQFDSLMDKYFTDNPNEVLGYPEGKALFTEMNQLYGQIHTLGYRSMPEQMYVDWLVSLRKEREKYENKKITNFKTRN